MTDVVNITPHNCSMMRAFSSEPRYIQLHQIAESNLQTLMSWEAISSSHGSCACPVSQVGFNQHSPSPSLIQSPTTWDDNMIVINNVRNKMPLYALFLSQGKNQIHTEYIAQHHIIWWASMTPFWLHFIVHTEIIKGWPFVLKSSGDIL